MKADHQKKTHLKNVGFLDREKGGHGRNTVTYAWKSSASVIIVDEGEFIKGGTHDATFYYAAIPYVSVLFK